MVVVVVVVVMVVVVIVVVVVVVVVVVEMVVSLCSYAYVCTCVLTSHTPTLRSPFLSRCSDHNGAQRITTTSLQHHYSITKTSLKHHRYTNDRNLP
jgi:hypothetical protein